MKTINNTTKTARQYSRAYFNATATRLDDVYKSYSFNKKQAFDNCIQVYRDYDGAHLKILSANTFAFTVGFITWFYGTCDLMIITKDNFYRIPEYEKY